MIHVDAYILTLSTHVPGNLAATLLVENPSFSNTATYHGFKPAERSKTRPLGFKARFRARTWVLAAVLFGLNQSIESIICRGCISYVVIFREKCWGEIRGCMYDCDSQGRWLEALDDLVDLVGVDA